MASSASRSGERMVHQDYIARIRYSNALPPPPNPPKLLNIPNTGLASGQYTTPGFASRLARDQPLNIEADAELGMPLDLVGMPGIFDGDESSIQAPLESPAPHPHDRALLRPLSALGKPKFSDSGVSFLRRTEYISSYSTKTRFDSAAARSQKGVPEQRFKRPAISIDKESPEYIKKQVVKSFETAASNLKEGKSIRHPTNRNLKLTAAYPLIPDLDGFTDAGGYVTIKFLTNPVPPSSTYDTRLESSLLRPVVPSAEEQAAKESIREAYELDPEHNPAPDDSMEYEFYLPQTSEDATKFKRKFDVLNPEEDDEELDTDLDGEKSIRFKKIRPYESATQLGSGETKYDEEVMIALADGSDNMHQRAAYYYPIVQRNTIRPQRTKNIHKHRLGVTGKQTQETHFLDVVVEDPTEATLAQREVFKEHPYGEPEQQESEDDGAHERDQEALSPEGQDGDQD